MSLWPELEKLQSATWVDLTHPLTDDSPYWAGIPEGSVELCRTVFDYDEEMLSCRIHTYKFPGQFGTHIDFPSHFTPGAAGSEAYGVDKMAMPLCVIDLTPKIAAEGPDTAVTVDQEVARYGLRGVKLVDRLLRVEACGEVITLVGHELLDNRTLLAARYGDEGKLLTGKTVDNLLLYMGQLLTARRAPCRPLRGR